MSEIYQFSEGFQLKVLALSARDKASFISYREVLNPKFFKKDIHVDLARIIHNHYDAELERSRIKGTDINPPTLEVLMEEVRLLTAKNKKKAKLKEDYQDTVFDIVECDLSDAEYIKDNLVKFGKNAAMKLAILESVDEISNAGETGDIDYGKIEERMRSAVMVGEDISDLGMDYFENAEERLDSYEKGSTGVQKVPTGLAGLDKVTHGGLGRSELGVIIAPPNRGKLVA